MSKPFRSCNLKQAYLLPPSLDDWLPEGHLARFVVETLDLSEIYARHGEGDGRGQAAYDPRMMVSVGRRTDLWILPGGGEFQRVIGITRYRQPASLRTQVFLWGAILGRAGHRIGLHLSAAWGGIEKRNSLFDKLLHYEIPTSRKLELQPCATG